MLPIVLLANAASALAAGVGCSGHSIGRRNDWASPHAIQIREYSPTNLGESGVSPFNQSMRQADDSQTSLPNARHTITPLPLTTSKTSLPSGSQRPL